MFLAEMSTVPLGWHVNIVSMYHETLYISWWMHLQKYCETSCAPGSSLRGYSWHFVFVFFFLHFICVYHSLQLYWIWLLPWALMQKVLNLILKSFQTETKFWKLVCFARVKKNLCKHFAFEFLLWTTAAFFLENFSNTLFPQRVSVLPLDFVLQMWSIVDGNLKTAL